MEQHPKIPQRGMTSLDPSHRLRLAMYQPDQPQSVGAMIRLCACLHARLDIIEPCGFIWNDAKLKRVAMDYLALMTPIRHAGWQKFRKTINTERIVLLTTRGAVPYTDFHFQNDDVLLVGQESAGAPEDVHQHATSRIRIPLAPQARSLNIVTAAAMVLGEALRQCAAART